MCDDQGPRLPTGVAAALRRAGAEQVMCGLVVGQATSACPQQVQEAALRAAVEQAGDTPGPLKLAAQAFTRDVERLSCCAA